MILLTIEEIVQMHDMLISKTGGSAGIRDMGLLESAVYNVLTSFENVELYPTVEEKAARYAYGLTSNHAFVDGNKRIGILVMLTVLRLNGVEIEYTQAELISLGLSLADGRMGYQDVLTWIKAHKQNML